MAGVLTRAVQDTNSHVNLKSKERNTPNAVLRDAAADHPRLAPFVDRPVHLVVGQDDFLLEQGTEEEVARRLAERLDRPLITLSWEPETRLRSFADMASGSPEEALALARRYGSKAANLGFLTHRGVLGRTADPGSPSARRGYDLVPAGFGVPFSMYADFVAYPPNSDLRTKLADLLAAEKAGDLSGKDRAAKVSDSRPRSWPPASPPRRWRDCERRWRRCCLG